MKKKAIIGLAPMAGITNEVFRKSLVLSNIKPDLLFTEFVSAESITKAGEKTLDALYFSKEEKPIIAQFFGSHPEEFYQASLIACILGYDGVDLNLGCSVRKILHSGGGAALINKNETVKSIFHYIQKGIQDYKDGKGVADLTLRKEVLKKIKQIQKYTNLKPNRKREITASMKTRTGTKEPETEKWISFLTSLNPSFISLHGRTVKQGYSGKADWEEIRKAAEIAHQNDVLLLGNGDIKSLKEAKEKIKNYEIDGVLIGRAAMSNPFIFKKEKNKEDILAFIEKEIDLFQTIFSQRNFRELRSHFIAYCRGFKEAKKMRIELVKAEDYQQVKKILIDWQKT